MRRIATALVVLAAATYLAGAIGCKRRPPAPEAVRAQVPDAWVREVLATIPRWAGEAAGVPADDLGVAVHNGGVRTDAAGRAYICDFRIAVTYGSSEFASEREDIPCSPDGFPTEEGNRRIKAVAEEIGAAIRAAR